MISYKDKIKNHDLKEWFGEEKDERVQNKQDKQET